MDNVFDNIYDKDQLKEELAQSFFALDEILVDHCGPFATNCVLGSKYRQVNDVDEFTKDGIKILRHLIVSEKAGERFAVRMTRFLGIAVDKRCHDGTTTAMLLFCRLAIIAISKMDSGVFGPERYNWTQSLSDILDRCLSYLETLKITEEDLLARALDFGIETTSDEIRASMAYHMAMISSKGDHDLSTKIAYVIKSSPKKIFGMFKDTPLAIETQESYILKKQDYDLANSANIGRIYDYNYKNDTQYLSTNAVIFATGTEINPGTMESLFLKAFIDSRPKNRNDLNEFGNIDGWETYHQGIKNLVILTPMFNDPDLGGIIDMFNKDNPDCKITWFNLHLHPRLRTSFNKTLHYMAGAELFYDVMGADVDPTLSFIGLKDKPTTVRFIGSTLTLSDLYEKTKEVYHPFYTHPETFEPYTRFCTETEELIEFANANISNAALDNDEVTSLTSLYRSLTCQEIYDIEIGGSAHDQYANRTVYEDAIGAALSAVNDGVVLGGYAHLAQYFLDDTVFYNAEIAYDFGMAFTTIVEDSLRIDDGVSVKEFIGHLHDKWDYVAADRKEYGRATFASDYATTYTLDKSLMTIFLSRVDDEPILLQAFTGYHEQFRRCKDILPKLANTTHVADMRLEVGANVL